jgi:ubiquinone/menaquinone biosynthesis C-methylase UbiE
MENKRQLSPHEIMALEHPYFELQAFIGTTKHAGGMTSTKELIAMCGIGEGTYVLEVGCGAGATPSYLVKELGARVVAVDLSPRMIALASERAQRDGVAAEIEFQVANACDLPFEADQFDVVMAESVLTFLADKPVALAECVRVTRPGGMVGLNEETWIQAPTPHIARAVADTWDIDAPVLTSQQWHDLLAQAGLVDVQAMTSRLQAARDASQVQRYHLSDMWRMLTRTLRLYLSGAAFRQYMKQRGQLPRDIFQYLGYGLYVGRKPKALSH